MPKTSVRNIKLRVPGLADYLKDFNDRRFFSDEIDIDNNQRLEANWNKFTELTRASDSKALKKKIVSFMSVADPQTLTTDQVTSTINMFRAMEKAKISEKDAGSMNPQYLADTSALTTAVANSGNLTKERFAVIVANQDKMAEPGKPAAVAEYIKTMSNSGLKLTSKSQRLDSIMKNRSTDEIKGMNTVLSTYTGMSGLGITDKSALSADIHKTIENNAATLADPKVAAAVADNVKLFRTNGYVLIGNTSLDKMIKNNPIETNKLLKVIVPENPDLMNPQRVQAVLNNMDKLTPERIDPLIACVKTMNGNIPLADKHHNLDRMVTMEPDKLTQTNTLLSAMGKLTQQRFNAAAALPELDQTKATAMGLCLKQLQGTDVHVSPTLAKLAGKNAEDIQNLAAVLGATQNKENITGKRFDVLMNNAGELDAAKAVQIAKYIDYMSFANLPLTDDNNRLQEMMKKDSLQIEHATSLLRTVGNLQNQHGNTILSPTALTKSKHAVIMDNIQNMAAAEVRGAEATIGAMGKYKLDVTSRHLNAILQTNPKETGELITALTGKDNGKGKERVMIALKNADKLDPAKMDMASLKSCISILESNNVPLTKNDTLKTLMSMNKDEMKDFNEMLKGMENKNAQEAAFQAIGSKLSAVHEAGGIKALRTEVTDALYDNKNKTGLVVGFTDKLRGKKDPVDLAIGNAIATGTAARVESERQEALVEDTNEAAELQTWAEKEAIEAREEAAVVEAAEVTQVAELDKVEVEAELSEPVPENPKQAVVEAVELALSAPAPPDEKVLTNAMNAQTVKTPIDPAIVDEAEQSQKLGQGN